jgi:hypothetical protein
LQLIWDMGWLAQVGGYCGYKKIQGKRSGGNKEREIGGTGIRDRERRIKEAMKDGLQRTDDGGRHFNL